MKIIQFRFWITTIIFTSILSSLTTNYIYAQKRHPSFKDSLDGAFDLSDWIIEYNGFVPVPAIITEPSLGGFGGALAPVFIKQHKPIVGENGKVYPISPDITAAFGGYTLNDTWAVGAARVASIPKWRLRYKIAAAYADVNMNYYFTSEKLNINKKEVEFNIKTIPIYLSVERQLKKDPRFSIGIEYLFMNSKLKVDDHIFPEDVRQFFGITDKDFKSNVGKLGLTGSFDKRDNVFTPNKGFKVNLVADWSNEAFGSDYDYGQFEGAFYGYFPLSKKLITGVRFDMQQVAGDMPFYIKPFIDMRGVPSAKYQGKTTMLAELEERWDFWKRWSLVFFGGTGKAFDDYSDFGSAEWVYSYGLGGRYLLARKLNLRMGADFAMGPDGFTYYIVFGTAWLRQ